MTRHSEHGWRALETWYEELAERRGIDLRVELHHGLGTPSVQTGNLLQIDDADLPVAPDRVILLNRLHFGPLAKLHGTFLHELGRMLFAAPTPTDLPRSMHRSWHTINQLRCDLYLTRLWYKDGHWLAMHAGEYPGRGPTGGASAADSFLWAMSWLARPYLRDQSAALERHVREIWTDAVVDSALRMLDLPDYCTSDEITQLCRHLHELAGEQLYDELESAVPTWAAAEMDLSALPAELIAPSDAADLAQAATVGISAAQDRRQDILMETQAEGGDWQQMVEDHQVQNSAFAAAAQHLDAKPEPGSSSEGMGAAPAAPGQPSPLRSAGDADGARGGYSWRPATASERRARKICAKKLAKLRWRDRKPVRMRELVPPGKVRMRPLIQASAQQTMGQLPTAKPFERKKHKVVEMPKLHMGILTDTSGSMGPYMEELSSCMWVLQQATQDVGGRTSCWSFGNSLMPVGSLSAKKRSGSAQSVMCLEANGGTDYVDEALEAACLELDFEHHTGPRFAVIISDGDWQEDGNKYSVSRYLYWLKSIGVQIMLIGIGKPPVPAPCHTLLTVKSVEDAARAISTEMQRLLKSA